MKNICVFLGATISQNPKFLEATLALGRTFAERNVQLVYGGAKVCSVQVKVDIFFKRNFFSNCIGLTHPSVECNLRQL
jgi:hypothetical protein